MKKYGYTANGNFNESEINLSNNLLQLIENMCNYFEANENDQDYLYIDENLPDENVNYSDEENYEVDSKVI